MVYDFAVANWNCAPVPEFDFEYPNVICPIKRMAPAGGERRAARGAVTAPRLRRCSRAARLEYNNGCRTRFSLPALTAGGLFTCPIPAPPPAPI
ncbi:hypothetical protein EVAR_89465_1 [Eumeta japonica]|uniref:Uncharacterized protein n=1 Tax=Eumeta variegata TaxID=151549 RepID=A0A4C1ZN05_EUMVA|nr:hypothetical protein EVAR_89465_1 [Eumeta japonica]